MAQVNLVHAAVDQALEDVRDAAGRLHHGRDRIDGRVRGYVGSGWTGDAADAFTEAWEGWKAGADDALEGLLAMGQLLGATRRDFQAQDDESERAMNQMAARIIDRLG